MVQSQQLRITLKGWEDGKPFLKENLIAPDRWDVQAADEVIITFPSRIGEIKLVQDPHSDELGGYLWNSSMIFAFLLERLCNGDMRSLFNENRLYSFLELGAGVTGLPAIALMKLGKHVIATDIPELIPQLQRNMEANRVDDIQHRHQLALELEWQEDADETFTRDVVHSFKQVGGLDMIIMADCVYSEASAKALAFTLHRICHHSIAVFKRSPQVFCITEVRNEAAQEDFKRFASEYFCIRRVPESFWHFYVPEEFAADYINLYTLTLK